MTTQEQLLRSIIQRIAIGPDRGKDISRQEAAKAMKAVMNDDVDPVHAALFLVGLRMKKETIDEYLGIHDGLNSFVETKTSQLPQLLYLADPFDGYIRNIPSSPFLPAILAACGIPCLIQGVESVGPKFGITSHQVYAALSLDPKLSTSDCITRLENTDIAWAYLDQQVSNPKLAALNSFRDLIVKRTAVTTAERLLLPIQAKKNHLALGFVHKAYPEIYGAISQAAGFDTTLLIKGLEGGVTPALDKPVRSFFVDTQQIHGKQVGELDNYLSNKNQLTAPFEGSAQELLEKTVEAGSKALKSRSGTFYSILIHNAAYLTWKLKISQNESSSYEQCKDFVTKILATDAVINRLKLK